MIVLEGIKKSFDGVELLRGIDLRVEKGESLALMGSSGSGKSVLLKIITGLVKPDDGQVYIDGKKIVGVSRRELDAVRQDIGMIFQSSALFDSMTIEENIGFALKNMLDIKPESIPLRVREAMNRVRLGDIEQLSPKQISGGMKKRVGIARAVVADPHILIADEPTAGLDPYTSRTIAHMLSDIVKKNKMTSVIVTASLEIAAYTAEKIAFLHEGKIESITTPQEMASSKSEIVRKFATIGNNDRKTNGAPG